MCLSFVACNSGNNSDNESAKKGIIGKWETTEMGGIVISFDEDGTGTMNEKPMKWKYDEELSSYIICHSNGTMRCVNSIETDENGNPYFKWSGIKIYRTDKQLYSYKAGLVPAQFFPLFWIFI